MNTLSPRVREVARLIDHTLLKPDATQQQIEKLCAEALEFHFFSVCVNPYWVPLVTARLNGSDVKVCTVTGFPLGATSTAAKAAEAALSVAAGASEIDMVINVGALRSGLFDVVQKDIVAVVTAAVSGNAIVKVILETALLDDTQKVQACELALAAGASFVKTSTGFAASGATVEDISLMRQTVGIHAGVKASGGIRSLADLERMVKAGASRIGASASIAIVQAAGA
jgi:deoxyribose-phosphate aldolase